MCRAERGPLSSWEGAGLRGRRGRGCCLPSLHACLTAAHLKTILEVFISLPLLSVGETSLWLGMRSGQFGRLSVSDQSYVHDEGRLGILCVQENEQRKETFKIFQTGFGEKNYLQSLVHLVRSKLETYFLH